MPSPQLAKLIEQSRAFGPFRGDVAAMRTMLDSAPSYPKPDDISWETVDADGTRAEWVRPQICEAGRAVVYLHGGGYATGSAEGFRSLSTHLARATRAPVLSVDYRLAPEHPYPAALDDAISAYGFVSSAGFDPEQIAFVGDSAGAGLALAAVLTLRDQGEPLPRAVVCLSPWTDLTLSGPTLESNAEADPMVSAATLAMLADAYLDGLDPSTPTASPLFAELHDLPPMLLQVGSGEVLLDDSRRFADAARSAGVEVNLEVWDDAVHVWQAFADVLPEARDAVARIAEFLDQQFKGA